MVTAPQPITEVPQAQIATTPEPPIDIPFTEMATATQLPVEIVTATQPITEVPRAQIATQPERPIDIHLEEMATATQLPEEIITAPQTITEVPQAQIATQPEHPIDIHLKEMATATPQLPEEIITAPQTITEVPQAQIATQPERPIDIHLEEMATATPQLPEEIITATQPITEVPQAQNATTPEPPIDIHFTEMAIATQLPVEIVTATQPITEVPQAQIATTPEPPIDIHFKEMAIATQFPEEIITAPQPITEVPWAQNATTPEPPIDIHFTEMATATQLPVEIVTATQPITEVPQKQTATQPERPKDKPFTEMPNATHFPVEIVPVQPLTENTTAPQPFTEVPQAQIATASETPLDRPFTEIAYATQLPVEIVTALQPFTEMPRAQIAKVPKPPAEMRPIEVSTTYQSSTEMSPKGITSANQSTMVSYPLLPIENSSASRPFREKKARPSSNGESSFVESSGESTRKQKDFNTLLHPLKKGRKRIRQPRNETSSEESVVFYENSCMKRKCLTSKKPLKKYRKMTIRHPKDDGDSMDGSCTENENLCNDNESSGESGKSYSSGESGFSYTSRHSLRRNRKKTRHPRDETSSEKSLDEYSNVKGKRTKFPKDETSSEESLDEYSNVKGKTTKFPKDETSSEESVDENSNIKGKTTKFPKDETSSEESVDEYSRGTVKSRTLKHSLPKYRKKIHNITVLENLHKSKKQKSIDTVLKERDVNNPKIYIRSIKKSCRNFGQKTKYKRCWNQVHACKFCLKSNKMWIKTNITKHFRKVKHSSEEEVKDVLKACEKYGPKSKVVRAKWDMLRNLGDHENNCRCLENGKGEVVLGRRPDGGLDMSEYGPCPNCLIWIKVNGSCLVRHQEICPAGLLENFEKKGRKELRILSLDLAGKISASASQHLKKEVYSIMTNDIITEVAQADPLIVSLGNLWLMKNIGNVLKRKYYTSSHMRGAAKLLINLQNITELKYQFDQFLKPQYFDSIVRATLITASPDFDDEEDLKAPSTAIKLGYDLKRLVGAKWGMALRMQDDQSVDDCKGVMKLMKFEWAVRVTKIATTTLLSRSYNKDRTLPEPEDLFKLQNHIKEEIQKLDLTDTSQKMYRRAEVLTQTRLLMYNKRRSGEIEVIRIKDYLRRQSGATELDKVMRRELSDLEMKLIETQDLMEVRGKNGRGVPIIIPPDVKPVLEYLTSADVRDAAGVLLSNKYLFVNTGTGVLRAYDSLKLLCKEVALIKPQKITSVSLRKYTATVSQVFDLSPNQQSWLTNHLGHTLDVHKIHYRQTSGIIERVDMAKIMLLQELNITAKYAGQKLENIQIPGLVFGEDGIYEDPAVVGNGERVLPAVDNEVLPALLGDDTDFGEDPDYNPDFNKRVVHDEFEFEEEDGDEDEDTKKSKKRKNVGTRVKWTSKELAEIQKYFKDNLTTKTTPGRRECDTAIGRSKKENGVLQHRNWETIKKKVWNLIQKL